ncbi:MAG: hypothetical protein SXV54_23020 [Chloroflexota bacterium]|nr:hypothetical protein [Chloroflexota bacterium]
MANKTDTVNTELRGMLPPIQAAQVDIRVHVSATLNVTPFIARQKVGGLVLSEVGTGIGTNEPSLIVTSERIVWRVPLFLALPSLGHLGEVGEIDVDAQTGEVLADRAALGRIIENAERLAPDPTL